MKKKLFTDNHGKVYRVHPKCCLFCRHCSDIWYDAGGIYLTICNIDKDIYTGSTGQCKYFRREK